MEVSRHVSSPQRSLHRFGGGGGGGGGSGGGLFGGGAFFLRGTRGGSITANSPFTSWLAEVVAANAEPVAVSAPATTES